MSDEIKCARCGDYKCPEPGCTGADDYPGCGGFACPDCAQATEDDAMEKMAEMVGANPGLPATLGQLHEVLKVVIQLTKNQNVIMAALKKIVK